MRELIYTARNRVEWTEVPPSALASADGALVRPLAVARCDLDVQMVARGLFPGPFPVGHEMVAEVVELGHEVTTVAVGDRVLVPFQISCGACAACTRGCYAACERYRAPIGASFGFGSAGGGHGGAIADSLFVPAAAHMLLPAPSQVRNAALATLSDNVVDAWRAVAPGLAARPGADVLIAAGQVPSVGLYAAALARACGAGRVIYIDRDRTRVEVAQRWGAEVECITGPWPKKLPNAPITVDATGEPEGLVAVLRSTEAYGQCTSVGLYFDGPVSLPLIEMYTRGVSFHTSRADSRRYLPAVLSLVADGRFDPLQIPTTVVAWADAADRWLTPATKLVLER